MSYYILPKINSQVLVSPKQIRASEFKPYVSYSLIHYIKSIKEQIDNILNNVNNISFYELVTIINPCEYIFSKIPGSKYSVSKLKPESNIFYEILEICVSLNVFDSYNSSISSLHITESSVDTIECFEMLRENFDDKITAYKNFDNINNDNQYDFLLFEEQSLLFIHFYFVYLANCLSTIFKSQKINGSCIIRVRDTVYKPDIDFMYILSSLYEKVYIIKPNSSDVTLSKKYIVCKNFQGKSDFSNINYYTLQSAIEKFISTEIGTSEIIGSFLDFETPYYFLSKIDDINVIIGSQQIEALDSICNLLKNKNREERIEAFKKTNIIKSVAWCEKHKIPCNKFTEKVNIFLPLNREKEVEEKEVEEKEINAEL